MAEGVQEQLIHDIINKTNSEIIIFFVIVLIALIAVFIPLYTMVHKDRKNRLAQEGMRQDKYIEREREIIRVITANTEVISGLKATLNLTSTANTTTFNRIHERIDEYNKKLGEQGVAIIRVQSTLEEIVRKGM